MNTTQQNKYRMFLAIQAALQEERETWKDHEAFAEAAAANSPAESESSDKNAPVIPPGSGPVVPKAA